MFCHQIERFSRFVWEKDKANKYIPKLNLAILSLKLLNWRNQFRSLLIQSVQIGIFATEERY